MATILENALLADLDPITVEPGSLRVDEGFIVERGARVAARAGDERVDCGGAVVLAGLVNGHTHLYSALAPGMPMPAQFPRNFYEILDFIWWRLDRALDEESVVASGRMGALEALKAGTTTLIDHHASPNWISGSLDALERGIAEVGPRAVLCYETTDRNGPAGRTAGLDENRRYAALCKQRANGRYAALIGAHAAFTLSDESLAALAELAGESGRGLHIHLAEDPCDDAICRSQHGRALFDRLEAHGLFNAETLFAHGTRLDERGIARLGECGAALAHNARSNMNNGVGYTPLARHRGPLLLGTDGIGADMFAEAQAAWFKSCDARQGLSPASILGMLATNARRASDWLGVPLGRLAPGAAADIVVTDYRPFTPLASENFPAHFIFAMSSRQARSVMIGGEWRLRDHQVTILDEAAARAASRPVARALWDRMQKLKPATRAGLPPDELPSMHESDPT